MEWRFDECLGKGAFGVVYKAVNTRLHYVRAIKQIKILTMTRNDLMDIMVSV
jgi:serine/threonine protein kinase